MKLNISFICTKACFVYRITQKISDILWTMLRNSWICILNCVSWKVLSMLNFDVPCDVYTVQRQSYTELLKSNRIFCLILGIPFENYFLTASNEGEDLLWLYFAFILNHSPMYEEI